MARGHPSSVALALAVAWAWTHAISSAGKARQPPRKENKPEEPADDGCMSSLAQLQSAVRAAAWNVTIEGTARSAVMLTSCDLKCMRALFEPFIWSAENNRDNDFSQHLIVVGNGEAAYAYCVQLQLQHRHQCVLDRWCAPDGSLPQKSGDATFRSPIYLYSLVKKVGWAEEISRLGVTVVWTDLDISYFGNPLKFLLEAAPDADVILNSENWGGPYSFDGDLCKFPAASELQRLCRLPHTGIHTPPGQLPDGVCCHSLLSVADGAVERTLFNGGVWLVNPTEAGHSFVRAWHAALFEDSVVWGKMWNGTATLDQVILGELVRAKFPDSGFEARKEVQLYKWDSRTNAYAPAGTIVRSLEEQVYMISGIRMQSFCGGQCGWKWNAAYSAHWQQDLGLWKGDGYDYAWEGHVPQGHVQGASPPPEDATTLADAADDSVQARQLVCYMPQELARKVIGFHQNCLIVLPVKRANMLAWRNWTVREGSVLDCKQQPPSSMPSGPTVEPPPLYIITTVARSQQPPGGLRRQYTSMHFPLVRQWIIVHPTDDHNFFRSLEPEREVLDLFHGRSTILETCLDPPASTDITAAALRNRGLQAVDAGEGLVYFLEGDSVIHPNFWVLVANNFSLGHVHTFDRDEQAGGGAVGELDEADGAVPLSLSQFSDESDGSDAITARLRRLGKHHVHFHVAAAFGRFSLGAEKAEPNRRALDAKGMTLRDDDSYRPLPGPAPYDGFMRTVGDAKASVAIPLRLMDGMKSNSSQQRRALFDAPGEGCGLPPPPLYVITPFTRKNPPEDLRRLYASMRFDLTVLWILVHDESEENFRPALDVERTTLEALYGRPKILEVACVVPGRHGQRNKGLNLTDGLDGLVYFVDGDNVVHPTFWALMGSKFRLGFIWTFDQFLSPPATVFLGDWVEEWHIDTAMYAIDRQLIGSTRFQAGEYTADGIFASAVYSWQKSKHLYVNKVAAFYNFGKLRFASLVPGLSQRAWIHVHG